MSILLTGVFRFDITNHDETKDIMSVHSGCAAAVAVAVWLKVVSSVP